MNSSGNRVDPALDAMNSMAKIVLSKSYGIPVYVQLYCSWVKEQILLSIKRKTVENPPENHNNSNSNINSLKNISIKLDVASIPRGPEDLLLGKFDKLSDMHKMVLKVASVIGYVFDVNMLMEVMQKQDKYQYQQQLLLSKTRNKQNALNMNTPSALNAQPSISFDLLCNVLERLEIGEWVLWILPGLLVDPW